MEQVGGDHYKSDYQHWDWAVDVGLGPLEYGATRYICRHWKKDGVEDLKKALHFVTKLQELESSNSYDHYKMIGRSRRSLLFIEDMIKFIKENQLPYLEAYLCQRIATWSHSSDLTTIEYTLNYLIRTSQKAAGGQGVVQATMVKVKRRKPSPAPSDSAAVATDTADTLVLKHIPCPICGKDEVEGHICGEPNPGEDVRS